MACVVHQKDCKQWFAELSTDLDRIMEITRYILNLYELWKSYDERKEIQGLLQKMPKPQTQPVPRWLESDIRQYKETAGDERGGGNRSVIGISTAISMGCQGQVVSRKEGIQGGQSYHVEGEGRS